MATVVPPQPCPQDLPDDPPAMTAGARSLVMSLWKLPDRETADIMEGFYIRWLDGEEKAAALRDAQLALIADLRARHGAAHPFFWAGFVLIGDWR